MVLVHKVFNNHLSAALLGCFPVLKVSHYTLNILLRGFWCAGTSVPSALGLVSPLTDTPLPLGFTWAPKHLSRTLRKKRKNPKTSRTSRKHELDSHWQLWGSKGGEFPLHSSSSGGHLGSIEGVQHFNYSGFPFWISKAAQWMQGENIHEMKGQDDVEMELSLRRSQRGQSRNLHPVPHHPLQQELQPLPKPAFQGGNHKSHRAASINS